MLGAIQVQYAWLKADVLPAFVWDTHALVRDLVSAQGQPFRPRVMVTRIMAYYDYYSRRFESAVTRALPPSVAAQVRPLQYQLAVSQALWRDSIGDLTEGLVAVDVSPRMVEHLAALSARVVQQLREFVQLTGDVRVEVPLTWRGVLEGFATSIVFDMPAATQRQIQAESGTNAEALLYEAGLPVIRRALQIYRTRTAAVFPWAIKHALPIEFYLGSAQVRLETSADVAGMYDAQQIHVFMLSHAAYDPHLMAATIAHEMGHHVWKNYLGADAQAAWTESRGYVRSLNLGPVIDRWVAYVEAQSKRELGPDSPLAFEHPAAQFAMFLRHLERSDDPRDHDLGTQLQVLFAEHGGTLTLGDLIEAVMQGRTFKATVPSRPITAYAETNAEEAFCEAFSQLIAHGPRRLSPQVRRTMQAILPEFRFDLAPPLYGV